MMCAQVRGLDHEFHSPAEPGRSIIGALLRATHLRTPHASPYPNTTTTTSTTPQHENHHAQLHSTIQATHWAGEWGTLCDTVELAKL
jgi:hypothetical protein